jgi:hypothetical protein
MHHIAAGISLTFVAAHRRFSSGLLSHIAGHNRDAIRTGSAIYLPTGLVFAHPD